MIDVLLILIFVCSSFFLWLRISQKIPELIAIPDEVITRRLEENSARLRLFFLQFRAYYKEGRHKEVFWKITGKILYKTHIVLLRWDNRVMSFLKKTRPRDAVNENGEELDKEKERIRVQL